MVVLQFAKKKNPLLLPPPSSSASSFIFSFIHSFILSLIHSFIHSLWCGRQDAPARARHSWRARAAAGRTPRPSPPWPEDLYMTRRTRKGLESKKKKKTLQNEHAASGERGGGARWGAGAEQGGGRVGQPGVRCRRCHGRGPGRRGQGRASRRQMVQAFRRALVWPEQLAGRWCGPGAGGRARWWRRARCGCAPRRARQWQPRPGAAAAAARGHAALGRNQRR